MSADRLPVGEPVGNLFVRTFKLVRREDISGVSGTGVVAEGVQFSNGKCALAWVSRAPQSVAIYDSLQDVVVIHGHEGRTQVVFDQRE